MLIEILTWARKVLGQNLFKKSNVLKRKQHSTAYFISFLGGGALRKLWRITYITLKFLYKKENWSILNLLLMVCHNNVICVKSCILMEKGWIEGVRCSFCFLTTSRFKLTISFGKFETLQFVTCGWMHGITH